MAGPDGQLAVASGKQSGGDAVVVAFGRPFEEAWRARLSVPEEYRGDALAVAPADIVRTGDGYAWAGTTLDPERDLHGWGVVRVDRNGNRRWSLVREDDPITLRALVAADGSYALAGTTWPFNGNGVDDAWVAELTTDAE